METWWNVLRWVLIVLATGFVGYVGRFGAQWLIDRARARRQAERSGTQERAPADAFPGSDPKDALKVEKKRVKAQAKAAKRKG